MSKHFVNYKAKCPFYRYEDRQIIYCGDNDITTIHRVFSNATDAKEYKAELCKDNFCKCSIYRMFEREIIEDGER